MGNMLDLEPYKMLVIANEASPRKGWVGLKKKRSKSLVTRL